MPEVPRPSTLTSSGSSTDESDASPSPPSATSLADLELFHNFVSHTYCTIGPEGQDHTPWRDEVPSLALSYPFLLHAILGLSAAHELSQDVHGVSEGIARQHYDTALRLFRETFTGVSCPETAAVFRSYTIVIAVLFIFWECERPSDRNPIDGFARLLSLLQGSRAIVDDARTKTDLASTGPPASVEAFLTRNSTSETAHSILDVDLQESLQSLHVRIRSRSVAASPDTTTSLHRALSALCTYHSLVPTHPLSGAGFMSWLFSLDTHFVHLLQNREPLALCMLAHWSVPLCNAPQKWYAGDWPRRLLETITLELGGEWQGYLRWPLEVTGQV